MQAAGKKWGHCGNARQRGLGHRRGSTAGGGAA